MTIGEPNIYLLRVPAHYEFGDLHGRVFGHSERFREIVARSGWNDSEPALNTGLQNRVRDSAAGPVSPDRNYRLGALTHGPRGEILFVARCSGFVNSLDPVCREG